MHTPTPRKGELASPGHCANLMNPRFRGIGLACVIGTANNSYRSCWTMTLGVAGRGFARGPGANDGHCPMRPAGGFVIHWN